MKLFSIKRKTDKLPIYARTTTVYKCLFGIKIKILHKYGFRDYYYCISGVRQYLQPYLFGNNYKRYPPASTKWEDEYFSKRVLTNLKPPTNEPD